MKIENLKIKTPEHKLKRDIEFNLSGISIIFANIEKDDNKETINSLGKTLFLKMIDYIFGCNYNKEFFKEEIEGYILVGTLLEKDNQYEVSRMISKKNSKIIYGDKEYNVGDYKSLFSVNRSYLDKQFHLFEKNSLVSPRENPNCNDYITVLNLLGLDDLSKEIKDIYQIQDEIKNLKKNKNSLLELTSIMSDNDLEEEVYLVDRSVSEYENKIKDVSKDIESIQTSELKQEVYDKYTEKNIEFKKIKNQINRNQIEIERMNRFIDESSKFDISSQDLHMAYKKAKIELPDYVIKSIEEAEDFHKKVFLDRKEYLSKQVIILEEKNKVLKTELLELSEEIDTLGDTISENKAYKESVLIYNNYINEFNELKYRQGQLSELKNITNRISELVKMLSNKFELSRNVLKSNESIIKEYQDFIYDFVKRIYADDVDAFFNISINKTHQKNRPLKIELNLRGDTGEGLGNVKKLLIDYLIFRYNDDLEIMVQDSSCYNGIDPRQVSTMIKELNKLSKSINKQAILSLNKYQLTDDEDVNELLNENAVLTLSEDDNLLGIYF